MSFWSIPWLCNSNSSESLIFLMFTSSSVNSGQLSMGFSSEKSEGVFIYPKAHPSFGIPPCCLGQETPFSFLALRTNNRTNLGYSSGNSETRLSAVQASICRDCKPSTCIHSYFECSGSPAKRVSGESCFEGSNPSLSANFFIFRYVSRFLCF